jgi:hypothetical protein
MAVAADELEHLRLEVHGLQVEVRHHVIVPSTPFYLSNTHLLGSRLYCGIQQP